MTSVIPPAMNPCLRGILAVGRSAPERAAVTPNALTGVTWEKETIRRGQGLGTLFRLRRYFGVF